MATKPPTRWIRVRVISTARLDRPRVERKLYIVYYSFLHNRRRETIIKCRATGYGHATQHLPALLTGVTPQKGHD